MRLLPLFVLTLLTACEAPAAPPAATAPQAGTGAQKAAPGQIPAMAASPRPNLARCPRLKRGNEDGLLERKALLPVPRALGGIAATDMNHLAVTTLDGKTGCVDVRWMEAVDAMALSKDARYLSFDWTGYEAYGHMIVDRLAGGQTIDTGEKPVWSGTGQRLAAIDFSESGFGALSGFGVWAVTPQGFKQLALVVEDLPAGDWRIAQWRGERCVALTLRPFDENPDKPKRAAKHLPDPWFASESNQWQPKPGACPPA